MNTNHPNKTHAFTLVEMLTVITVILILAAILLNVSGYVGNRSARARTEMELRVIETMLERYKADNGEYPRPSVRDEMKLPAGSYSNSWIPSDAQQAMYQGLTGDGNSALGGLVYSSNNGSGKGMQGKNYFESQDLEAKICSSGGFAQNTAAGAPPLPAGANGRGYGVFNDGWGRSIIYGCPGSRNTGTYDLYSDGGGLAGSGSPSDNPGWVKNW